MNIYLVKASTGEYDDYQERNVCFYATKKKADEHVKLATKAYKKILKDNGLTERNNMLCGPSYHEVDFKNQYDEKALADYTGIDYFVEEVWLGILDKEN